MAVFHFSCIITCIASLTILAKAATVDDCYYIAFILTIAGFILGPIWGVWNGAPFAFGILMAGANLFVLFMWQLLFELIARNPLSGIALSLFGSLALEFGFVVDALLWYASQWTYAAGATSNSVAVVFFCLFLIYCTLFLRGYSFENTIKAVQPVGPLQNAERDATTFDQRCEEIIREYKLTPRERDIFLLLARGRNSRFIEESLVVSRNTVKTHTRNIYLKLGVHSHQELIDAVDNAQHN